MDTVTMSSWKQALIALIFWIVVSIMGWGFVAPWVIQQNYKVETFVTNLRQDGPPRINVTDGKLVYGEASAGGSPMVYPDWLAQKTFYDYRTVYVYRDNPLGEPVCTIDLNSHEAPYRNRKGSDQSAGYSLDRWTNGKLRNCKLGPGDYVIVTDYKVPVVGGLFNVIFSFTSNTFTITGVDK